MAAKAVSIKALRERIQQLEAENLAMRKSLDGIKSHAAHLSCYEHIARVGVKCAEEICELLDKVKTPQTAALSKCVSALEAVAEAAHDVNNCMTYLSFDAAKERLLDRLQKLEQAKKEAGK